jgi:hypothetical protein
LTVVIHIRSDQKEFVHIRSERKEFVHICSERKELYLAVVIQIRLDRKELYFVIVDVFLVHVRSERNDSVLVEVFFAIQSRL